MCRSTLTSQQEHGRDGCLEFTEQSQKEAAVRQTAWIFGTLVVHHDRVVAHFR